MTWSAPACISLGIFSALRVVAMMVQLWSLARRMAQRPRLLVPSWIRTVEFGFHLAASKREPQAIHMLMEMSPRTS